MKVIPKDKRDFMLDIYNNNQPRRDFVRQSGSTATQLVSTVFREPMHQVLEKIKNKSYFQDGRRLHAVQQNLHCQYHQEQGHTTKNCRMLWNHLEQLVKVGKLKQFLYQPNGQGSQTGSKA